MMKKNQKIYRTLTLVFAFIDICLSILYLLSGFKFDINIVMVFLGITVFFNGFNQINISHKIDSKEYVNVDKIIGIFSIVLGIVIIISIIIKII